MLFEVERVEDGSRDEEESRNELSSPDTKRQQLVPLLVIRPEIDGLARVALATPSNHNSYQWIKF